MKAPKEIEDKLLGKEFHHIVLARCFGEIILEYWHFKVAKVYSKTTRVKTITEVGAGFCTALNTKDLLEGEKQYYYPSLEAGLTPIRKFLPDLITKYKKDLEGYTDKHPDYKYYQFCIGLMERYNILVNDYSIEKHEAVQKQNFEGYKALGAGRHRHR